MKAEYNIALILLAAGDGRRFGGNKLLYALNGKPMYRYLPDELEAWEIDHGKPLFAKKIVVTQYEVIEADLGRRGYEVVKNTQSCLGISHSIQLGLGVLEQEKEMAICFAVCDQPYLKAETVADFLRAWQESGRGLGSLIANGKPGNPAVFSHDYLEELLALSGDIGGRRVLKAHPEDLFFWETKDERELEDLDRPG